MNIFVLAKSALAFRSLARGILLCALLAAGDALAQTAAAPHLVTVTGSGVATGKPDRARLTLEVDSRNVDLKTAQDTVNGIVRSYLQHAKSLGARDEDLGTTGVSVVPEYVWEEGKGQRFTGFRASRRIDVRITDLDRLGDFVLRATADGVTQVDPPLLESSKADELARQALARAADNARAKARLLAEQLGAKLGGVARIIESGGTPGPVPMLQARARDADGGNGQMGISLGEIRIEASITADFDLLPP